MYATFSRFVFGLLLYLFYAFLRPIPPSSPTSSCTYVEQRRIVATDEGGGHMVASAVLRHESYET